MVITFVQPSQRPRKAAWKRVGEADGPGVSPKPGTLVHLVSTTRLCLIAMEREVNAFFWKYWNEIVANGPLIGLVAAYVAIGGAVVGAVVWDLQRYYRDREWRSLRFWFRKVRELMPKGVKGTNDDNAKHVASTVCYEALFNAAAEGRISWKKHEYFAELLAIAFDAETLRKEKTHRGAMLGRIRKNIESVKAGPKGKIPGDPPPAVGSLSYLKKSKAA